MPSGLEWGWVGINALLFAGYFAMRGNAIAEAGNLSIVAFFTNLRSLPEEFFKMMVPVGFSVMPGYSLIWTLPGVLLMGILVYFIRKYKPDTKVLLTGASIWLASLLPSLAYEPSFAGVAYDYLDHRAWFPYVGLWMIVLSVIDSSKFVSQKYSKSQRIFINL